MYMLQGVLNENAHVAAEWEWAARRTKKMESKRAPLGPQLKLAGEVIEELLAAESSDSWGR